MQVFHFTLDKVRPIHSFSKHVVSTYCVLGSSLSTGGMWDEWFVLLALAKPQSVGGGRLLVH